MDPGIHKGNGHDEEAEKDQVRPIGRRDVGKYHQQGHKADGDAGTYSQA